MKHIQLRNVQYVTVKLVALLGTSLIIIVASGCSLERDEHTVQFQQLQSPSGTEALPVWLDVYSKSVIQDVYSPQGNSEVLP
ncbi:hypothetical protein ASD24_06635 [Paenibacillus sp. Root52]|uniref:hypothetical protein n=1 Tax=Paenibacillus sp. Root52 TaxID=1736552 RepID=UPI0006FD9979|nr:hypothetical protein [Paenibacillus sp. Root52]KQY87524.1 hypothetical protein ASD24_06635 [Paenibacillus sp. Root52]